MLILLTAVLIAALAAGGTLAYLTAQTERRINTFSFASELDARLVEPNWDGIYDYEYDGSNPIKPLYHRSGTTKHYGYTGNGTGTPITTAPGSELANAKTLRPRVNRTTDQGNPRNSDKLYGDEASVLMSPGTVAEKNPMIFNTSTQLDEWVAAKITFVYASGDDKGKPLSEVHYDDVIAAIDINWTDFSAKWETIEDGAPCDGQRILLYKEILTKSTATGGADPDYWNAGTNGITVPMFSTVTLKADATNAQVKALEDMGGFAIYIEGFVVQAEVAATYSAFKTWALNGEDDYFASGTNLVFNNTPNSSSTSAILSQPGGIFSKLDA